jgi:release factor glutamine methyltransferase
LTAPELDAVVARLRAAGCVFAEEEARLLLEAAESPADLERMLARRVEGYPLEPLLGWAAFHGLRIAVDPGVFVPRVRTEFLVELALRVLPDPAVVVDLCCGAGAIGVALATTRPGVELVAADIEPAAVRCARRNLEGIGTVLQGDLYTPLPASLRGRIDVLAVNAPYVPTDEIAMMPPEARLYEPLITLDGGGDGLDLQRRIVADAHGWLADGGHLLIETSERQAPTTLALFRAVGLDARIEHSEDVGGTVVIGRRSRPE